MEWESTNKLLNTAQERAIKDHIMRMDKKNMSLMFRFVEDAANFVFRETDSDVAFLGSC